MGPVSTANMPAAVKRRFPIASGICTRTNRGPATLSGGAPSRRGQILSTTFQPRPLARLPKPLLLAHITPQPPGIHRHHRPELRLGPTRRPKPPNRVAARASPSALSSEASLAASPPSA